MTDKNKTTNTEGEASGRTSRPTLFNLLEVLANYSMTTPSQRQCIRDIVTEFLANKFEHSKVYSYIGAVVGHDRLHSVIKQLEADPDRSPLPDQDGLMKIESAFNLTRNYKSPNNTNGDGNANNKDEILRSIRRNLSKKCELTRSSSVRTASAGVLLQKACWLPIRRPLTAGPLYGHSLICIGNRAYILGGSSGRSQGFNLSKAHVVNLLDFSSKQIMLSGEVPSHREGNSCNVAVLNQTHAVVLFGGFNGEVFFNDLYLLDLEKRRWTKKNPTGPLPTPRDEHSSLVYPPRCDLKTTTPPPQTNATNNSATTNGTNNKDNNANKTAEAKQEGTTAVANTTAFPTTNQVVYLFVFGGKTGSRNQFQCLNDMWAYNVLSNYWTMVETGENKPSPRFGVCALWADDETVCVFGGETSSPNGYVDRTERVLLDDLWMFHLTSFNKENTNQTDNEEDKPQKVTGMWLQDYYEGNIGPRSHYSSIFIAQRCKEVTTGAPRTIERLMFLTGGLTYAPGNKKVVVASDKLYFYFFSQKRWYSLKPNYPRNYLGEPFEPRQLHVACFFEKKNILFPGTKPSVPCIFFHGGFHKKQILSDSWVLSLTGEDLFFKNSLLSPESSASPNKVELRMYPPWYYRESHSPSLLWGMCSVQKWVFGALAHLVDNSLKESVSSTSLSVKFESSPKGEELMLSVQDDGNGLDYNSMNRLLKLFGRSYTTFNAQEDVEPGNNKDEYGLGFKLAYGRLGNSVAVMSRTHDSIGIGMLSLELMCQCESREMAAPMCMWKLPSKELINRDGPTLIDQRHHQRLLMSYSPFNSAALLAEQINVLGVNPGTRLLFWQLRDDLDNLVLEDGTLLNSSTTLHMPSFSQTTDANGKENKDHVEVGSVVYLKEHLMEGGIVMDSSEHLNEHAQEVKAEENAQEEKESLDKKSQKEKSKEKEEEKVDGVKKEKGTEDENKDESDKEEKKETENERNEEFKKLVGYHGDWYEAFPLWKKSKHAMDYCLPVYLYWLHLHSSCTLSVQDVQLKPNPMYSYLFDTKKTSVSLDDLDHTSITGASIFDSDHQHFKRARDSLTLEESALAKKLHTELSPSRDLVKHAEELVQASELKEENETTQQKVDDKDQDEQKKEHDKKVEETQKKGLKLLGTTVGSRPSNAPVTNTASSGSTAAATEDYFLDLHSHTLSPHSLGPGFLTDNYSCEKNNCSYCGVSPVGRSLAGGETLYSFLKAKLHKSVQLPFLFHPEDHAQGCFALMGFLNDPTETMYLASSASGFNLERASNASVTSGSSNLGGLPSPTNKPLAPTSFVVTDPVELLPDPKQAAPADQKAAAVASPTKARKGKGHRGRPPSTASSTDSKQSGDSTQAKPAETKEAPASKVTQVIFSGSLSAENLETQMEETPSRTAKDSDDNKDKKSQKDLEREKRLKMFAGVGAGAQLNTSSSLGSQSMEKATGPVGSGFFTKQFSTAKTALEDRVCEAGVLLYYKGRLIRRLEGNFPAPLDDLEGARLPPKPSLFKGELYRFALTAVVNVPSWLVPSITKQEFLHENNLVFLQFKTKLIKLLSEYCKVCLDDNARHRWYSERVRQLVAYDLAHQTTLNSVLNKQKDELEGLEDEVVPSWKLQDPQDSNGLESTTANSGPQSASQSMESAADQVPEVTMATQEVHPPAVST